MKKDIKDYLHLYVGRKAMVRFGRMKPRVRRISLLTLYMWFGAALQRTDYKKYYDIKPILRPLSDMTEEERENISRIVPPHPFTSQTCATITKWYLERGFDVFGLCEAGLAIDKNTLKQEA